jgi:hypothetical protein
MQLKSKGQRASTEAKQQKLLTDAYHSPFQPTMNASSPPWNEIYGMKITENELFNYENKIREREGGKGESTQILYLIKFSLAFPCLRETCRQNEELKTPNPHCTISIDPNMTRVRRMRQLMKAI